MTTPRWSGTPSQRRRQRAEAAELLAIARRSGCKHDPPCPIADTTWTRGEPAKHTMACKYGRPHVENGQRMWLT